MLNVMKIQTPAKPNDSDIIWRYIGLDKLIDLLLTRTIKFSQLAIAADQNEVALLANHLIETGQLGDNPREHERLRNFITLKRVSVYVGCWTRKEQEARSLWYTYLDKTLLGVAIKSTVSQVRHSLRHTEDKGLGFTARIVDYRDVFNTEELQSEIIMVNTKATPYKDEDEVRFYTHLDYSPH